MRFIAFLLVLGMVAVLGCQASETTTTVEEPGQEQIKPALEAVAQSGVIDSSLMVVREEAEAMKATDAAKAEELLKDLDELEALSDPEQIKAKAKEMAGKL